MANHFDPADYQLHIARGADEAITSITVTYWTNGAIFAEYHGDDAVADLLASAREIACSDPYDDTLPDDESIIQAAVGDCLDEEEDATDPRPILDRLAEAQTGLASIGEVIDDWAIQTVADAHDVITEMLAAARDMLVVWDGVAHPALAYPEGSPAARLRDLIAKWEG